MTPAPGDHRPDTPGPAGGPLDGLRGGSAAGALGGSLSGPLDGLRGGLMVCGTTSDAGKSFVVAGLCRLLARHGVRVAPFKAQNMANNAAVTAEGAEIGHAQWVQAVAAGAEPTAAMNPILLKPTSERTSQVVVRGRAVGEMSAAEYHAAKDRLRPVVLDALAELRDRYDVVVCEGAGSPAEINLLDRDLVNLGLADAAGLPAVVVGDIDRGGVFAALYGTVALLPDALRARVRGFVVNRLRGDPALLGSACTDLEERCGVPTLGVLPHLPGIDLDAEDSLALDRLDRLDPDLPASDSGYAGVSEVSAGPGGADRVTDRTQPGGAEAADVLDVVAVRWPLVANAGDLDPLRIEPHVRVRWVRSVAELGRPDLVFLPGSKATRADLDWFRRTGMADAVARSGAPIVAVCAGLQMCGRTIADPGGTEGPPGTDEGLGWLPVVTEFDAPKVLDRPDGRVVAGPGRGERVAGYRIHHGRVRPLDGSATGWMVAGDGSLLGVLDADAGPAQPVDHPRTAHRAGGRGPVCGTTLHALFEDDGFRTAVLTWVAACAGKRWRPSGVSFPATRLDRLDRIADLLDAHLDLDRLSALIVEGANVPGGLP